MHFSDYSAHFVSSFKASDDCVTGDVTSIWITLLCVCIIWKYVLCVECESVCTLYIMSCMSK